MFARERGERLGENAPRVDLERLLAAFGDVGSAGAFDEVTLIYSVAKEGEEAFVHFGLQEDELEARRAVKKGREDDATLCTSRQDTSRECLGACRLKRGQKCACRRGLVGFDRVRLHARCAEKIDLF